MKKILLIALCSIVTLSFSQRGGLIGSKKKGDSFGLGPVLSYNWQTKGPGAGIRAFIPVKPFLAVIPEVAYYPDLSKDEEGVLEDKISELFIGPIFQFHYNPGYKLVLYASVGVQYHKWFNYEDFNHVNALTGELETKRKYQETDIVTPLSIGIMRGQGCFRPFLEQSYGTMYPEGTTKLGFYYVFKACSGKGSCPAYDPGFN